MTLLKSRRSDIIYKDRPPLIRFEQPFKCPFAVHFAGCRFAEHKSHPILGKFAKLPNKHTASHTKPRTQTNTNAKPTLNAAFSPNSLVANFLFYCCENRRVLMSPDAIKSRRYSLYEPMILFAL